MKPETRYPFMPFTVLYGVIVALVSVIVMACCIRAMGDAWDHDYDELYRVKAIESR